MANKSIIKLVLFILVVLSILYVVRDSFKKDEPETEPGIEQTIVEPDPISDSIKEVLRIQDELKIEAIRKEKASLLNQYKGSYQIMIDGDGSESYTLMNDGTCTWEFRGGKKQGLWTARKDYLYITIKGNTDDFVYEYYFKDGKFVDKENPKSYLKKRN